MFDDLFDFDNDGEIDFDKAVTRLAIAGAILDDADEENNKAKDTI